MSLYGDYFLTTDDIEHYRRNRNNYTMEEEYKYFQKVARKGLNANEEFDTLVLRYRVPLRFRMQYDGMLEQKLAKEREAQANQPPSNEAENKLLARQVAAAMGIAPDDWVDDSMP